MNHPEILRRLTLEQKVALLSGRDVWHTHAFPQAGVPGMLLSDGPHGVRRQTGRGDHLGLHKSEPATCFPTAAALANSWDEQLLEACGRAIGEEAVAQGVNVLLGPGLNTKRNPLGGRNFEYFSEDPYLSGKLAAALIRGVQENGIAACPKHLAANSQELLRMTSDSVVDERTLRELYLTNFEIAVREGKPLAVMSSYNRVNGTYAHENPYLLTQVLRREWGFSGMVVSDWGGCNRQSAALRAGGNLEMPGTYGDSDREVFAALAAGELTEEEVDRRVDQLLTVVLSTQIPPERRQTCVDWEGHHALARQAAAQSGVLLKNEGGLLPLAPGKRVAVLGEFTQRPRFQGAGSSLVCHTKLDLPLDCLTQAGLEVVGHALCTGGGGHWREEAAALARRAEVVLLYLGLPDWMESEGMDRSHMELPSWQGELVEIAAQSGTPVVAVLAGGAPVEVPWADRCGAILHSYLGGQAGAGAVADLLTGRVNPSGKLAETYPFSYQDVPNRSYFPGRERTSQYREALFVGYRYYLTAEKPVRWPFGFGLSYTTFRYEQLKVSPQQVSFTLTNTGERAGSEIAQLYVACPGSRLFRPRRELKGFSKVFLQPGESRACVIPLDDKAFRYFHVGNHRWEVEGGTYTLEVGASAEDIRLSACLEVAGTGAPIPYDPNALACYYSAQVEQVPDCAFAALLGRPVPPLGWEHSAPLDLNDSLYRLPDSKGWLGRLVGRSIQRSIRRGEERGVPSVNGLYVASLPIRGLAKLSNGWVSTPMARSLLQVVNGHTLRGLWGFIRGFGSNEREKRRRKQMLGSSHGNPRHRSKA